VGPGNVIAYGALLDPQVLTVAFARRFTGYKRPDLILYDPERLKQLVTDPLRPIQVIFAGEAHPDDTEGKRLIQTIFHVAQDPRFAGRIAFVEDYDQELAGYMVHGVDVWLNNPVPPMEASGTSGMKVSVNGVPHGFVQVMKAIQTVAPAFGAQRMVKEYANRFYAHALGLA